MNEKKVSHFHFLHRIYVEVIHFLSPIYLSYVTQQDGCWIFVLLEVYDNSVSTSNRIHYTDVQIIDFYSIGESSCDQIEV